MADDGAAFLAKVRCWPINGVRRRLMNAKLRWKMHEKRQPGTYKLTLTGKEPLYVVVDENGEFETDGLTDHLIYVFAKRVRPVLI
jgi:hypothetical protein